MRSPNRSSLALAVLLSGCQSVAKPAEPSPRAELDDAMETDMDGDGVASIESGGADCDDADPDRGVDRASWQRMVFRENHAAERSGDWSRVAVVHATVDESGLKIDEFLEDDLDNDGVLDRLQTRSFDYGDALAPTGELTLTDYDADGSYDFAYSLTVTLDAVGNPVEEFQVQDNDNDGNDDSAIEYYRTFDARGNLTSMQQLRFEDGRLRSSSRTDTTWNAFDQVERHIVIQDTTGNGLADYAIVSEYAYTYTDDGLIAERSVDQWATRGGTLTTTTNTYTYDAERRVLMIDTEKQGDSEIPTVTREAFDYLDVGERRMVMHTRSVSAENSSLNEQTVTRTTYDRYDRLISVQEQLDRSDDGDWDSAVRTTYSYDENGLLTGSVVGDDLNFDGSADVITERIYQDYVTGCD
jgi:hypothetical protein